LEKDLKRERIFYLDFMRVTAMFSVIILHVAAYFLDEQSIGSYEWNVMTIYDSFVRFSVPLFVMISGVLWLDSRKKVSLKKIYKKNILKLVISFAFWSIIYAILETLFLGETSINEFVWKCIEGHYHMWFLYMIVGLYIVTPLIRKITNDEKLTKYFLIISLITGICIETIKSVHIFARVIKVSEKFNIYIGMGYVFYFVLGYYLSKKRVSKGVSKVIYILGIISAFVIFFLTRYSSLKSGKLVEDYFNYLNLFVLAESVAAFVFIKNMSEFLYQKERAVKCISKISVYCFGIYLIHDLAIQLLLLFNFKSTSFNPAFSIPIIAVIVFIISFVLVFLIGKVKGADKYII